MRPLSLPGQPEKALEIDLKAFLFPLFRRGRLSSVPQIPAYGGEAWRGAACSGDPKHPTTSSLTLWLWSAGARGGAEPVSATPWVIQQHQTSQRSHCLCLLVSIAAL